MLAVIIFVIAVISNFVQTTIGFGAGLIAMPLLAYSIGIDLASPAFAVIAVLAGMRLAWHYRNDFRIADIWRLLLSAIIAIPFGVFLATEMEERTVLILLGIVTASYALYNLLQLRMPTLKNRFWGFLLGAFSGILHGAYNTGGPPLVIYGNSQQWQPLRFKGNLQVIFIPMSVIVIFTHAVNGHYVNDVWQYVIFMIPGVVVGQLLGFYLEPRINPMLFRRLVLVGLLFLGITLILP